jgi:cell division protein FtsN
MKNPDDKDGPGTDASGRDASGRHKSDRVPGGVQHDSRGNAVWQWAAESGRHLIDSTSRLLKRLEVPGLSVEGEESEEQQQLKLKEQKKTGGYNPYETTRPASKGRADAARDSAPRPAPPAAPKPPVKSAPPAVKPPARSWLGKVFGKD